MPLEVAEGSITLDFAKKVAGGALAEDVEGDTKNVDVTDDSGSFYHIDLEVLATSEVTLATKTLVFDATSLAFAAGFACISGETPQLKLRLYMGGVLMQETVILDDDDTMNHVLRDFKALSGSQACALVIYNTDGSGRWYLFTGNTGYSERAVAIAVGSVKLA